MQAPLELDALVLEVVASKLGAEPILAAALLSHTAKGGAGATLAQAPLMTAPLVVLTERHVVFLELRAPLGRPTGEVASVHEVPHADVAGAVVEGGMLYVALASGEVHELALLPERHTTTQAELPVKLVARFGETEVARRLRGGLRRNRYVMGAVSVVALVGLVGYIVYDVAR